MNAVSVRQVPARVQIVEDDKSVAEALRRGLVEQEYVTQLRFDVHVTASASFALEQARNGAIDIFVVDLGLEDERSGRVSSSVGTTLVAKLVQFPQVAVVVYTVEDKLRFGSDLIELGADDFIQKTDPPKSAVQKVAAVWRRIVSVRENWQKPSGSKPQSYQIGRWSFTIGRQQLTDDDGNNVSIGVTEHEFLRNIVLSEGNVITTEALEVFVARRPGADEEKMFQNLKYRLSKKLGPTFKLRSIGVGAYKLDDCRLLPPKASRNEKDD